MSVKVSAKGIVNDVPSKNDALYMEHWVGNLVTGNAESKVAETLWQGESAIDGQD